MKKIGIYDTSVQTMNVGDLIIMDAVKNELNNIFSEEFFVSFSSRNRITFNDIRWIRHIDKIFVGGTNLLSSNMNKNKPWKIGLIETFLLKNIILLGVGWNKYQNPPNLYTKLIYKNLIKKKYKHSVRDNYTFEKLKSCGIENVINTSCPTTWTLTEEHCKKIAISKADEVITTITDYKKDYIADTRMIEILLRNYSKVYLWLQGMGDYEYYKSLKIDHSKIILIPPRLEKYDDILKNNNVDFVGTRLHAGIRALQNKKRTIIIGVDNRAKEIHKDININVLNREEIHLLEDKITSTFSTDIKIPIDAINAWKEQFIL